MAFCGAYTWHEWKELDDEERDEIVAGYLTSKRKETILARFKVPIDAAEDSTGWRDRMFDDSD